MKERCMSEFDATTASQILGSVLSQFEQKGLGKTSAQLDQLTASHLITNDDKETLETVLSKGKTNNGGSGSAMVSEVDAILKEDKVGSEVAKIILNMLKLADNLPSVAVGPPPSGQHNLQTIPNIPWDSGAASDGIVEGGAAGAGIGILVGDVPGAIFGAAVGGVIGGLVEGFGHGWLGSKG
jgi:hypothetical protein